jgi:steroid delta-isomerase-like uncharacterized protein
MAAWNAHDAARVSSFYTSDYVGIDVSITEQQRGPEAVRCTVQHYLEVFPDLYIQGEEIIIDENRVAVKVQVNGTHRGIIMNIPATGRFTEIHGVAFLTFEDEKIKQASYLWDVAGFLRGIGLLPDL